MMLGYFSNLFEVEPDGVPGHGGPNLKSPGHRRNSVPFQRTPVPLNARGRNRGLAEPVITPVLGSEGVGSLDQKEDYEKSPFEDGQESSSQVDTSSSDESSSDDDSSSGSSDSESSDGEEPLSEREQSRETVVQRGIRSNDLLSSRVTVGIRIQVLQQKSVEEFQLVPLKPGEDRTLIVPLRLPVDECDEDSEGSEGPAFEDSGSIPPEDFDSKLLETSDPESDQLQIKSSSGEPKSTSKADTIPVSPGHSGDSSKDEDASLAPLKTKIRAKPSKKRRNDIVSHYTKKKKKKGSKKRGGAAGPIWRKSPQERPRTKEIQPMSTTGPSRRITRSRKGFYEIESILAEKEGWFLIKWSGHSLATATWEPRAHLSLGEEMVRKFVRRQRASKGEAKIPVGAPPPPSLCCVENILAKTEDLYLVKWVDQPIDESTWHTHGSLAAVGMAKFVDRFERKFKCSSYPLIPPDAPQPEEMSMLLKLSDSS